MTTDEIETAAIEAATRENFEDYRREFGGPKWDEIPATAQRDWLATSKRITRAYERAMWRPIEEAPKDGTEVIVDHPLGGVSASVFIGGEWRIFDGPDGTTEYIDPPTHFRPTPRREGE